jgi:hypothetical protein
MGVDEMRDYELKLRDLHTSDTLGSGGWGICCLLRRDKARAKDNTYTYECRCNERLKDNADSISLKRFYYLTKKSKPPKNKGIQKSELND